MLKFIETLKNIWTIDELKNRILITLFFLIIYRLAAQVVLPGVDYNIISEAQIAGGGGLLGLLNAFTGGAFANASVVALGKAPPVKAFNIPRRPPPSVLVERSDRARESTPGKTT